MGERGDADAMKAETGADPQMGDVGGQIPRPRAATEVGLRHERGLPGTNVTTKIIGLDRFGDFGFPPIAVVISSNLSASGLALLTREAIGEASGQEIHSQVKQLLLGARHGSDSTEASSTPKFGHCFLSERMSTVSSAYHCLHNCVHGATKPRSEIGREISGIPPAAHVARYEVAEEGIRLCSENCGQDFVGGVRAGNITDGLRQMHVARDDRGMGVGSTGLTGVRAEGEVENILAGPVTGVSSPDRGDFCSSPVNTAIAAVNSPRAAKSQCTLPLDVDEPTLLVMEQSGGFRFIQRERRARIQRKKVADIDAMSPWTLPSCHGDSAEHLYSQLWESIKAGHDPAAARVSSLPPPPAKAAAACSESLEDGRWRAGTRKREEQMWQGRYLGWLEP